MSNVTIEKDLENLTLEIAAEFDASADQVWQIWENPRKLERWWGPPTWPATFEKLELHPDGAAAYYMTGPDGEKARGWWRVVAVDPPTRFEFEDGFADENGHPVESLGSTRAVVTITEAGSRTRMSILSRFESLEQMEEMVKMGMEEGMSQAFTQIDALLDTAG